MNTLTRIRQIFRDIFDDMDLLVTMNTTKFDIEDWDSIAQVKLVLMIEGEFNIRLTTEEVATIKSVADFIVAIEKHAGV